MKIAGWRKQKGTSGLSTDIWKNDSLSMSVRIDKLPYKKPEYEVYYHNHLSGVTTMSPMDKCFSKNTAMIIAANTMRELNFKVKYVGGK